MRRRGRLAVIVPLRHLVLLLHVMQVVEAPLEDPDGSQGVLQGKMGRGLSGCSANEQCTCR